MNKYNIILKEGWMGDTLWAFNICHNLKQMGYDIIVSHKWKFMNKFLELFDVPQLPLNAQISDYVPIIYTHRIDHYQNPLLDYIKSFNISECDIDKASQFYSIQENFYKMYGDECNYDNFYITYDDDWQNRTKLNIDYIVSELRKHIEVIPIGGNRFTDDCMPLIESSKVLINSQLHLGMCGGTTHLATYLNTQIIGSSDHLYQHYKKNEMSPEEFLNTFHPFPKHYADNKHIITSPIIDEDEFIQTVLNQLKIKMNSAKNIIKTNYIITCNKQNDLNPYCPVLDYMASNVSSVVEMGIGPLNLGLNSTWGLLHGLNRSTTSLPKKYIAYDYPSHIANNPLNINIFYAQKLAKELNIYFNFIEANSVEVKIDNTDLLFIDTDHRYQHLMQELELHHSNVNKYILIHDTSGFYGYKEDRPYNHESRGELKNSPEKYGLWACVVDFLKLHPEWRILKRYEENYGLTILERIVK